MRNLLILLLVLLCLPCIAGTINFSESASLQLGYKRYNRYSNMITIPMELDGGASLRSLGNFVGTGFLQYSTASADSKYFNKFGLKMAENLSHQCMLVYADVDSYIRSSTFTVGWWMRVDEIASVSSTLNDGFNVYLRNSGGLDYIRIGLVYYPNASDTTKLDAKMAGIYRNGATFDSFSTATTTLNVGQWNHFMIQRYLIGGNYYIVFIFNDAVLGFDINSSLAANSLSFANYLWLGWFGFGTPLTDYTRVSVSVDDFFYTPTIFNEPTPPSVTLTNFGSLIQKK